MNDLNELVKSLSEEKIKELLYELGAVDIIERENFLITNTICHNVDAESASMKLYYYKDSCLFYCFTDCDCGFNIIELFKKRYELLDIEYNFYYDIVLKLTGGKPLFLGNPNNTIYESEYEKFKYQKNTINLPTIPDSLLNIYTYLPITEWLEDGINESALKQFNILYSIRDNKIIIPHYNANNQLIGIRARMLNEEDLLIGKYLPVQIEDKIYSHPLSLNLYGLNQVKDNIKKYEMAIVAESEKAVLQYNTMFPEKNICVACCGSSLHEYQIDLLLQYGAKRILIAFDKEGENWKKQTEYYEKLMGLCQKFKYKCQMGFIYDSKNLLELKDSPFDRGIEVTKELIKRGVWSN